MRRAGSRSTANPDRPACSSNTWIIPEENKKSFVNGWYYTGDKVSIDDDGYFWFVGRNDDVIKSSGYRIRAF